MQHERGNIRGARLKFEIRSKIKEMWEKQENGLWVYTNGDIAKAVGVSTSSISKHTGTRTHKPILRNSLDAIIADYKKAEEKAFKEYNSKLMDYMGALNFVKKYVEDKQITLMQEIEAHKKERTKHDKKFDIFIEKLIKS
jgi:hypothetical protein